MKKFTAILVIIVLVLLASACNIHAQYASKGVLELGGTASFSSVTQVANGTTASNSTSMFQFSPYAGYFIAEGISIGVEPSFGSLKMAGDNNSYTALALYAIPGYTFATKSSFFPYVQGMIGYTSIGYGSEPTQSGISWGLKGGVKFSIGNAGLICAGVTYQAITVNPSGANSRYGFNVLSIGVGYSIFFK